LRNRYELSTINNFISAVLWDLSHIHDQPVDDIRILYQNHGKTIKSEIERLKLGHEFELTEREQKSFMKWEDVLHVYQNLLSHLDPTSFQSFLDFVIVSLYVLQFPVRADYAYMKVFIDDSFVPLNYTDNFCVLQTNPRFVFHKYKTAKHKGVTIIPIDPVLHDILLDWMELNPTEYLLASYMITKNQYKIFTENTLCKRITTIFKKHSNIPVTINTLRHSYLSYRAHCDHDVLDRKTDTAHKMMHSTAMAEKYQRTVYRS